MEIPLTWPDFVTRVKKCSPLHATFSDCIIFQKMDIMKRLVVVFLFFGIQAFAAKEKLYLFPGHGSDERIFSRFQVDTARFDTIAFNLPMPHHLERMPSYAKRVSASIDTTGTYSFIGVSLGGMLSVELNSILRPRKVIIISSAACRKEIPPRYRGMKNFQLYRCFSGGFYKAMAKTAQLTFEPDRKKNGNEFDAMLRDKNPKFIKRAIHLIVTWERECPQAENVIHLHGTKDHTLPVRFTNAQYRLEDFSHMMMLTSAEKVSEIITYELNKP